MARKDWNGSELKLAWLEVYTPPLCLGVTSMLRHGPFKVSSVQFSSVTQSCPTLCDPIDWSTLGFLSITNSQSLLKLMSIESVMPSNHLILCGHLFLSSIFPSIRVFSNESVLHIRWQKHWSFSFSISPSNEYSGLISFRKTGWISFWTTVQKHQFFDHLSLFYSPTFTSIHDYWKNHSLD